MGVSACLLFLLMGVHAFLVLELLLLLLLLMLSTDPVREHSQRVSAGGHRGAGLWCVAALCALHGCLLFLVVCSANIACRGSPVSACISTICAACDPILSFCLAPHAVSLAANLPPRPPSPLPSPLVSLSIAVAPPSSAPRGVCPGAERHLAFDGLIVAYTADADAFSVTIVSVMPGTSE